MASASLFPGLVNIPGFIWNCKLHDMKGIERIIGTSVDH